MEIRIPLGVLLAGNYKVGLTPRDNSKVAVSLPELLVQTNAFSIKNRPGCVPQLVKSDPKNLMLQYRVTCHLENSDPRGHETRVQFDVAKIQEDQNANDLDVQCSCSCPAFLYWGAQWNLHQRDGLLGQPRPLLQAPTQRLDLRNNFVICKHCKAVFERILPSVQHNINNIIRKKKVEETERRREEEGWEPPTIRKKPVTPEIEGLEDLAKEEEKKLILEQEGIVQRETPATTEERKKHPTLEKPTPRWRQTLDKLKERVKGWGVPTPEKPKPEPSDREVQEELLREERQRMKSPATKEHPKGPHLDKGLPYEPRWKQVLKKLKDRIKSWGKKSSAQKSLRMALEELRPVFVQEAQAIYEAGPEHAWQGICYYIASAILETALSRHPNWGGEVVHGTGDEHHSWAVICTRTECFKVDIPFTKYEKKVPRKEVPGNPAYDYDMPYTWESLPDVEFQPSDIKITPASRPWKKEKK